MSIQEWHIKSRADHCLTCERHFEDNETICSRLEFGEEGYVRHDHCRACWRKREEAEGYVSYWQSIYKLPAPPKPDAVQKETAESLLRKLLEEEDPTNLNTIYILAVMLERKRILVEKDVQKNEDGSLIRIYEHKKSGEAFLIHDPQLKLSELEDVQTEVVIRLGGKPAGSAASGPDQMPSAEDDTENTSAS
jgi:hypothetical protein